MDVTMTMQLGMVMMTVMTMIFYAFPLVTLGVIGLAARKLRCPGAR